MLTMVSVRNLKIFTEGLGYQWLSLSKEDMLERNVLCIVCARDRAGEVKLEAVGNTGSNRLTYGN